MAETRIIIGTPTDDDPLWDDFELRQDWLHKHDDPEPDEPGDDWE